MQKAIKQKLKNLFPLTCFDEPLSKYSTFRIGGKADAFIEIDNLNAVAEKESTPSLQSLLKFCYQNNLSFFILGGGSNVIFHDKGFRGIVIKITANKLTIKTLKNKKALAIADAGLPLAVLVKKVKDADYSDFDSWLGIPGTVGGAVRGNAGAQGLEIKDTLLYAEILNPKTGLTRELTPKNLKMKYRSSSLKKDNRIVLRAVFELKKNAQNSQMTSPAHKALSPLLFRLQNQPKGYSAGSFFKNPTKFKAGYLIDQCGLKGLKIGGAQISDKHANFFLNIGAGTKTPATQKDILALAARAKKEVYKKFEIRLKEEVQIVPEQI